MATAVTRDDYIIRAGEYSLAFQDPVAPTNANEPPFRLLHPIPPLLATASRLAESIETLRSAEWSPASIKQAIICVHTMHRLASHTTPPATTSNYGIPKTCRLLDVMMGTG